MAQNNDNNLSYTPNNPKNGQVLKINFNPKGTNLENKNLMFVVYSVKNGALNAEDYQFNKTDSGWEGEYSIPDSSKALGIKFITGNFENDFPNKLYPVLLYGNDGKVLKGSKAACAYLAGYQGVIQKKADTKTAYKYYCEEFKDSPALIKYYLSSYCNAVKNEEKKNPDTIVKEALLTVEKEKNELDESSLQSVMYIYKQGLKNNSKGDEYYKYILNKFPNGEMAKREARDAFYKMRPDADKMSKALSEFNVRFGSGETYEIMVGAVLVEYCSQGKYDSAKELLKKYDVENNLSSYKWMYGLVPRCAAMCLSKGNDEAFAIRLNDLALKLGKALMELKKPNPDNLTSIQYRKMTTEFAVSSIYPVAVNIYEKTRGTKEALELAEEGCKLCNSSKELKHLYTRLLVANKRANEALPMLDELIMAGDKKEDLLKVHKSAYEQVKGSTEGYESYLSGLMNISVSKMREDVKKKLVAKPAPQFTLKDTEGKTVSLADFKGKIVILDFWATWCSPCKASFPYMKKAQERYTTNPDVKFLFVNTYEKSENPAEGAAQFIKANNYPFHVAVDAESKVSASYEVSSIPTKIFIDREGNIRYVAVGFEETTIQEEIDEVINLIK